MIDYEQQQALVEARQLHIAAPVILPILERIEKSSYQKLIGDFQHGKLDNVATIAELSVIAKIKHQIRSKLEPLNQEDKI